MGTIYSRATQIHSWLGHTQHAIAECMQTFKDSADICWSVGSPRSQKPEVRGILDNLLQHPYWTRTWILQEIVLARSIIVHCSSTTLDWDVFIRMTKRLCAKAGVEYLSKVGQSHLMRLHEERANSKPRTLPHLLHRYQSTQCLDPRDRVFALVGLINVEDDPLRHAAAAIDWQGTSSDLLDYSLPLPVLFVRLLKSNRVSVMDTFAWNLWEAFGLAHYKFSRDDLNLRIDLPVHFERMWPADEGMPFSEHRLHRYSQRRSQRRWQIICRSIICRSVPGTTSDLIPLNLIPGGRQVEGIPMQCQLYAHENPAAEYSDFKSPIEVLLPRNFHDAFRYLTLMYTAVDENATCRCYINTSVASFIALHGFLNSTASTIRKPLPGLSLRSELHVPTRLRDVIADNKRQIEYLETAFRQGLLDVERRTELDRARSALREYELLASRRNKPDMSLSSIWQWISKHIPTSSS